MFRSIVVIVGTACFLGGIAAWVTDVSAIPTFAALFWGAIFGTAWARLHYKPAGDPIAASESLAGAACKSAPDPAADAAEQTGSWGRIASIFWGTVALAVIVVPVILWFAAADILNSLPRWAAISALTVLMIGMTAFCVAVTWVDFGPAERPTPPSDGKQSRDRSPHA